MDAFEQAWGYLSRHICLLECIGEQQEANETLPVRS